MKESKITKRGVWCWPCLDERNDRVQAVVEIDGDPFCEICARKHRREAADAAVAVSEEVFPAGILPVEEPRAYLPTGLVAAGTITILEDGPPLKRRCRTKVPPTRETVLHASSDEEHEANQAWAELSCDDKWSLMNAAVR